MRTRLVINVQFNSKIYFWHVTIPNLVKKQYPQFGTMCEQRAQLSELQLVGFLLIIPRRWPLFLYYAKYDGTFQEQFIHYGACTFPSHICFLWHGNKREAMHCDNVIDVKKQSNLCNEFICVKAEKLKKLSGDSVKEIWPLKKVSAILSSYT